MAVSVSRSQGNDLPLVERPRHSQQQFLPDMIRHIEAVLQHYDGDFLIHSESQIGGEATGYARLIGKNSPIYLVQSPGNGTGERWRVGSAAQIVLESRFEPDVGIAMQMRARKLQQIFGA